MRKVQKPSAEELAGALRPEEGNRTVVIGVLAAGAVVARGPWRCSCPALTGDPELACVDAAREGV